MLIEVQHWSGAGNRFVIVDNRLRAIEHFSTTLVKSLCQRDNLPNAEGLLVLAELDPYNSSCTYTFYNPDGSTGVMCGNGARCAVRHAITFMNQRHQNQIQLILNNRIYKANICDNGRVALKLSLYTELRLFDNWTYVDVGSHHIVLDARNIIGSIDDFYNFNLIQFANENLDFYREKTGIPNLNLNIAYPIQNRIQLRTYENGVFDETQACGTGAVSTAISFWTGNIIRETSIEIIPISERSLTVHLIVDDKQENILEMVLEGDAVQDMLPNKFNTNEIKYEGST